MAVKGLHYRNLAPVHGVQIAQHPLSLLCKERMLPQLRNCSLDLWCAEDTSSCPGGCHVADAPQQSIQQRLIALQREARNAVYPARRVVMLYLCTGEPLRCSGLLHNLATSCTCKFSGETGLHPKMLMQQL